MRIAICFFSYNKDAELLKQALRGVKRLREKNLEDTIDAYVVDDHNAPLEQELLPEWVNYTQTTFDRRRNLNGLECIQGMLSVFADLVSKGYEWVIKADSDTYINNLEWLRALDPNRIAHVGSCHVLDYSSGACYALSSSVIAALQEKLTDPIIQKRVDVAYCEDKVFCRLSRMTNLGVLCRHNDKNEISSDRLYHDWYADELVDLEKLKEAAAVDFKRCMWHIDKEYWNSDREVAEVRMKEYADYVEVSDTIDTQSDASEPEENTSLPVQPIVKPEI